eukprot:8354_1
MLLLLILLVGVVNIKAAWVYWGGTPGRFEMYKDATGAWPANIHVTIFIESGDIHSSYDRGSVGYLGGHYGYVHQAWTTGAAAGLQQAYESFSYPLSIWAAIRANAYSVIHIFNTGAHNEYYNRYNEDGGATVSVKSSTIDEANPGTPTEIGLKIPFEEKPPSVKTMAAIVKRLNQKDTSMTDKQHEFNVNIVANLKQIVSTKGKPKKQKAALQYFNYNDEGREQYMIPQSLSSDPQYIIGILLLVVIFAFFCICIGGSSVCIAGISCYLFGEALQNKVKQNTAHEISSDQEV